MSPSDATLEHLLRLEAPQVLAALVRRFGHFDLAEDAVQEALMAASRQWTDGIPADPRGWLIRIGYRRLIDLLRSDQARRRREHQAANLEPRPAEAVPAVDDSVTLLLLCCHPALNPTAQVALTLRAVGGLSTAEIAHAYGPERGLALLDELDGRHGLAGDPLTRQRERAVRAHLSEMTGEHEVAAGLYREAAALTANIVEQRYLLGRAHRLGGS